MFGSDVRRQPSDSEVAIRVALQSVSSDLNS